MPQPPGRPPSHRRSTPGSLWPCALDQRGLQGEIDDICHPMGRTELVRLHHLPGYFVMPRGVALITPSALATSVTLPATARSEPNRAQRAATSGWILEASVSISVSRCTPTPRIA